VNGAPRRVRLDLAYDGTAFAGWQLQPGRRTIQGTLEEALSRLQGDESARVRGAGRTDAGVHARRQVADCLLASRLDDGELAYALRGILPADLRALAVRTVPQEFHSRRDAVSKSYRYRLDLSPHGDPFLARFALHPLQSFDRSAVEAALERLPGRRDWSAFAASVCEVEDRVRHLEEARYEQPSPEQGWLSFTADGFLTHMVRNLVGTLLEIARGRMAPDRLEAILDSRDRRLAGPTAPARGLILWEVRYRSNQSED
jgi:tRNA pseudouridine38-40 synthase